jgi:hypothetical protein
MACKNRPGFVDEDWVGPDLPDALHQAGDLALRMPAGIAWKWLQVMDRTPYDPFRQATGQGPLGIGRTCDPGARLGLGELGYGLSARQ